MIIRYGANHVNFVEVTVDDVWQALGADGVARAELDKLMFPEMKAQLEAMIRTAPDQIALREAYDYLRHAAVAAVNSGSKVSSHLVGVDELIALRSALSATSEGAEKAWVSPGVVNEAFAEGTTLMAHIRTGDNWERRIAAEQDVTGAGYARLPIPMLLWCPECKARHVDKGEFTAKLHHTHSCQKCGLTWRPAVVHTVGVQFLPGFKDKAEP